MMILSASRCHNSSYAVMRNTCTGKRKPFYTDTHYNLFWNDAINLNHPYYRDHTVFIYIENTMFVSFDIKFIRRHQIQCRICEAC